MLSFHLPRWLALPIALLIVSALLPTALAGSVPPTSIQGEYNTNLGQQTEQLPVNFLLEGGIINKSSPVALSSLHPSDIAVSISSTQTVKLLNSAQTAAQLSLTGIVSGLNNDIIYDISSPTLVKQSPLTSNEIKADLKLDSASTLHPPVSTYSLSPAVLTITFPTTVNLEPGWPSNFTGPVEFQITVTPEPPSFVHGFWVAVLALMMLWRRRRGAVAAA